MKYCLYSREEANQYPWGTMPPDIVLAQGVVAKYGFHPQRLEESREKVRAMLSQLDDTFHKDKGGGMSFLNMCMDREGRQWGEQMHCDDLLCLGLGLGMVSFCLPRELWSDLPGGVPYIAVDTQT